MSERGIFIKSITDGAKPQGAPPVARAAVDRLTQVENLIKDETANLRWYEDNAQKTRAALVPLLSAAHELANGIAVGRVLRWNGYLARRKPNPEDAERAVIEAITWTIPGPAMGDIGVKPKPQYKLRRINRDGKLSKVTHLVNGLWAWEMTGESLDMKKTEWA